MMKWIKLALRNIFRNRRRSFTTIIAIAVGFASISLYYGYIHHTYWAVRFFAVHGEGLGHLRINKEGWKNNSKLDKLKYMFSYDETQKIMKLVNEEKNVILSTPQLYLSGLVSNGTTSTYFVAEGVVPKDDKIIKNQRWINYAKVQGKPLSEDTPSGVEISSGLGKQLNLAPGKDGVAMTTTLDGQMKALDVKVTAVFNTGNDFYNDKYMRFNFNYAQSLLDTQSAERIVVLLDDIQATEKMRKHLLRKLSVAGINCEIQTWDELSVAYTKIKSYLDAIFIFLFSIILIIVAMTTINTMSMVILERTNEIGTLRALGLKRKGVSMIFALEGAFLGLFGSILGIVLHSCVVAITRYHKTYYTPPGSSSSVSLYVDMVPDMLAVLFFSFILLSSLSAVVSARRAGKKNIVDALGHV